MANNEVAYGLLNSLGGAIAAQANRPQKTSSTTTSKPLQLADMLARRNTIGNASANLAKSLKQREGLGYNLAAALSNVPQQQGYGNWLSGGAKSFGDAFNSRANMAMDNAQKQYDTGRTDLADALMFDKSMGEKQTEKIEYNGNNVVGQATPQMQLDVSAPLPENKAGWGESTIQSGAVNPDTGVPTMFAAMTRNALNYNNPTGPLARQANVDAYTQVFSVPKITDLMKATGGSRGIDTMPEVNIKGGPELSSANMPDKQYISAVQDQAYNIAGQILAANPKATISREGLANAFINQFNSNIQPKYRVVGPLSGNNNSPVNTGKSPEELDKLLGDL